MNVLVCKVPGGFIGKMTDFGLAHTLASTTAGKTRPKGAGSFPWMAPEVYDGHYSEASDGWAAGLVVYVLSPKRDDLTGWLAG